MAPQTHGATFFRPNLDHQFLNCLIFVNLTPISHDFSWINFLRFVWFCRRPHNSLFYFVLFWLVPTRLFPIAQISSLLLSCTLKPQLVSLAHSHMRIKLIFNRNNNNPFVIWFEASILLHSISRHNNVF